MCDWFCIYCSIINGWCFVVPIVFCNLMIFLGKHWFFEITRYNFEWAPKLSGGSLVIKKRLSSARGCFVIYFFVSWIINMRECQLLWFFLLLLCSALIRLIDFGWFFLYLLFDFWPLSMLINNQNVARITINPGNSFKVLRYSNKILHSNAKHSIAWTTL